MDNQDIAKLQRLTPDQLEVLRLRGSEGLSAPEIAKLTFRAESTIYYHLDEIHRKLEIKHLKTGARFMALSRFADAIDRMPPDAILPAENDEANLPKLDPSDLALVIYDDRELLRLRQHQQGLIVPDLSLAHRPPDPRQWTGQNRQKEEDPIVINSRWLDHRVPDPGRNPRRRFSPVLVLAAAILAGFAGAAIAIQLFGARNTTQVTVQRPTVQQTPDTIRSTAGPLAAVPQPTTVSVASSPSPSLPSQPPSAPTPLSTPTAVRTEATPIPAPTASPQAQPAFTAAAPPSTIALGPTHGALRVSFTRVDSVIRNQPVTIFSAKKDDRRQTVQGAQVASGYTDNTGAITFDLPAGDYVVVSDLPGYNWGNYASGKGQADVSVQAGQQATLNVPMGRLTFTATFVDRAIQNLPVSVFVQRTAANRAIVRGDQVASGYTANTGTISFDLTPGHYVLASDIAGYNWGDLTDAKGLSDVVVEATKETVRDVSVGRVTVAVHTSTGAAAANKPVGIYLQRTDASGKPVLGDQIAAGYTANTGFWTTDVSPGSYAVQIDSQTTFGVVVQSGRVTEITR